MIIESRLSTALGTLQSPPKLLEHRVVPALLAPAEHSTYRPEYGWQFTYERRLLREQRALLDADRSRLIGSAGLLSEALSNAYLHGNGRDPTLPIIVELYAGSAGYVLRVAHHGRGFDVAETLMKFRSNQSYFNVAGNGLRRLDASRDFEVFFSPDGRAVHLVRKTAELLREPC